MSDRLPVEDSNAVKFQLAQLAYDIFGIALSRSGKEPQLTFEELDRDYRDAWTEGVWAAVETAKTKNMFPRRQIETITKKQEDSGYLIYSSVRLMMKENPGKYTYAKFPEELKDQYRALAQKVYYKIDAEGEEPE